MKYKLVVLDLDNTLLNEDNIVTDRAKTAIAKIREKGVKVIIATGRMLVSAIRFVEELDLEDFVITYNGGYIKDLTSGEIIFHQPLDLELAKKVVKEAEEKDLHINIYQDDQLYVAEHNQFSRAYEKATNVTAKAVGLLSEFMEKPPTKLLIIENDREKQQYYLDYFKDKYKSIEVTESKRNFIEFCSKGVSKGRGLEVVTEYLGIELEETIAFGDGWNDLTMIETAGLGIAMENAPEEVKEKADRIALHHDKDGTASMLEEIFNLN